MKPLRLAVIGAGHLGRIHARLAAQHDDVQLVAVCDPCPQARAETARENRAQAFTDCREIVDLVDAAIVATPTHLHHQIGTFLAGHGIHLLVEKPLAGSLDEATALVHAAERHQVVLQVGHVERFNAALQASADHLADAKYIEARRLSGYPFRSTDIGVVLDLMIHDLDIVLSLIDAPVRQVDALGLSVLGRHEDVAQARLQFENGSVVNLTASRVSYAPCRHMQVWTSRGFVSLDFAAGKSTIVEPDAQILNQEFDAAALAPEIQAHLKDHLFDQVLAKSTLDVTPLNAIADEQRDFVQCIRQHRTPIVSGSAGRDAVALAGTILESIDRHQWDSQQAGRRGPFALRPVQVVPVGQSHDLAEPVHRKAG